MKKIVWKAYYDYEKEEKWLNEMSAKGLALTNYTWCRYVFEDEEPGKYIYRLELLDNLASSVESQNYIDFIEDSGIEHVASYLRWIYVRKLRSEGDFDIYTDIESKITHSKRVYTFWFTFMIIELLIGIANVSIGLSSFLYNKNYNYLASFNFSSGMLLVVLGLLFMRLGLRSLKKAKQLQKEKMVRE